LYAQSAKLYLQRSHRRKASLWRQPSRLGHVQKGAKLPRPVRRASRQRVVRNQPQLPSSSANMSKQRPRKASSMSKWFRGIYNAAANFNMSRSLRAAAGRILDRDTEHVREECNKSDQHVESSQSVESSSVTSRTCTPATCSCARTSTRNGYRIPCACSISASRSSSSNSSSAKDGDLPNPHGTSCSCPSCRDYAEYTATFSSKGEGVSTWVRISNEPRSFKQTNADATDRIEQCTGIPAGVTV
jgi:hypothetical protein